ncbi:hypothetical protein [Halobaculum magnesiiphilum]|uniref:Uncharacterized protein n=1 Tax=Halobaculum magnesiiphilum TaxID=1017351 RepID=A0A8T8WHT5_9EURY|nr:hypothetical protein [Halobaculum magnesiiphilum]QZP39421.1 hypothetical protein K6T50_17695 [Halobaculum magnesiiphilum]
MSPDLVLMAGVLASGAFTLVLGIVHFAMPWLLDFDGAIPTDGDPLRPLELLVITYQTKRSDLRGIAQIMNHAVSYTLVSIGLVELLASRWLSTWFAPYLLAWIAGWWFLRATTQRHMGSRTGDRLVAAGFALIGVFHFAVAVM